MWTPVAHDLRHIAMICDGGVCGDLYIHEFSLCVLVNGSHLNVYDTSNTVKLKYIVAL